MHTVFGNFCFFFWFLLFFFRGRKTQNTYACHENVEHAARSPADRRQESLPWIGKKYGCSLLASCQKTTNRSTKRKITGTINCKCTPSSLLESLTFLDFLSMFASCSVWCWILNVMALSPQQCARSQSSRHGQWNRTWSGQADRPSLKNPWLFLCNKAMIMVSDDGYARPRDPCLFETTRTKHSRHHLISNFNIFDARAVPSTKPNPSAPIIVIHVQNLIYGNHFSVCFDEACSCNMPSTSWNYRNINPSMPSFHQLLDESIPSVSVSASAAVSACACANDV